MSTELTWHTGGQGDDLTLHIEWFDENNVPHRNTVWTRMLDRDKPRTLAVVVDGETTEMAKQSGYRDGFTAALKALEDHATKWQNVADELRNNTSPASYEMQSSVARELRAVVRKVRHG